MDEFGVGVVGFGFMGRTHAYGYLNLPLFYDPPPARIRLVGVCTRHEDTARKAQETAGFEFATTNVEELIARDDIHIINCCTPNKSHREVLLQAMAAGKHVYCDKPLARNAAEARELADASRAARGKCQMALNYRFLPATLRAKQLMEDGALGDIFHFRACYLHAGYIDPSRPMSWRLSKEESGGGALFDLGSHVLDLMYHLLGPYESVSALCETIIKERPLKDDPARMGEVEVDDVAVLNVRMASGAFGTIEASRFATGAQDELRFEIHGSKGAMKFNLMDPNWLYLYRTDAPGGDYGGERGFTQIECVQRYPAPSVLPAPKVSVGWIRGHLHSLYSFVRNIAEDRPASPNFCDAAHVHDVMEAAYRSAESGAWADVPPTKG